ncbi:group 3 secretory phospholipase A2-like [Mastacembelus armatus]|uniref:group 3 secretory phospholipase A2-like n=1 Tax=Mastacembelus armatus TaxID=205130 RepID=UPI000E455AFA|nr:group 3 secretory phospholipase A2-like [Mastacembelus armatus]
MRLVACEVNTSPFVTESYATLCDRSESHGQEISLWLNMSIVLDPNAPCARHAPSAPTIPRRSRRDGTEGKARKKRAWIFPGTLWCGKGSEAVRYEQLGMFENADRCCREHDHCLHIIPAFTVKYGVFNPNIYTVSHCDCDERFRQCLLGVNDTISTMVGYSFFNILQIPCFQLKQQRRCTEMYWWGVCKITKEAPYAVFKSPLPYNTSDDTSKYGENADSNNSTSDAQNVTESPAINPHRKSPKCECRCSSKEAPRGDTFHHRMKKGKGCKKHRKLSTVAPSQMSTVSRTNTTAPSVTTGLLSPSKSATVKTNQKKAGKKMRTRKGPLAYPARSHVPPQVTTDSYLQTPLTTKSTLSLKQKPTLQLHLPTNITAANKTMKRRKKVSKQSHCCGSRVPVRGDNFQPLCKTCLEQDIAHMITVSPVITENGSATKATTLKTMWLNKTTITLKQGTLETLWNTTTSAPIISKLKTAASIHKDGKPQKQRDSHLLQDNTSQNPVGGTIAQSTNVEKSLRQNNALRNMTGIQHLCGSLKHLDECKYKIPPLERKYNLQNVESKTAYHCDCTSRLAESKSFKQPSVLPTLLMDFVSQFCFKLPKEKKCHRRKSCSGGFTKASDLLRKLKKLEGKDRAENGMKMWA